MAPPLRTEGATFMRAAIYARYSSGREIPKAVDEITKERLRMNREAKRFGSAGEGNLAQGGARNVAA